MGEELVGLGLVHLRCHQTQSGGLNSGEAERHPAAFWGGRSGEGLLPAVPLQGHPDLSHKVGLEQRGHHETRLAGMSVRGTEGRRDLSLPHPSARTGSSLEKQMDRGPEIRGNNKHGQRGVESHR